MELHKAKAYKHRWIRYRDPRNNILLKETRHMQELIEYLQLKTVVKIRENKKPYIAVFFSSPAEAAQFRNYLKR